MHRQWCIVPTCKIAILKYIVFLVAQKWQNMTPKVVNSAKFQTPKICPILSTYIGCMLRAYYIIYAQDCFQILLKLWGAVFKKIKNSMLHVAWDLKRISEQPAEQAEAGFVKLSSWHPFRHKRALGIRSFTRKTRRNSGQICLVWTCTPINMPKQVRQWSCNKNRRISMGRAWQSSGASGSGNSTIQIRCSIS
jgi:hypothetical protein